ncbi:thioesterase family protein [bacterium]|nr:thioesterase family protein [bacterium]
MNLWLRMIRIFIKSLFVKRIGIFDSSKIRFRCWPNDLDVNMHMNNGRYLTLMDLGRTHFMSELKILWQLPKKKWFPVVGAVDIQFMKAIDPFQPFEIFTQLLTWDDKWFYVEQRFERNGKVYARAELRALFLGKSGRIPPEDVIKLSVNEAPPPPVHPVITRWEK